jgi:hypothetical protein
LRAVVVGARRLRSLHLLINLLRCMALLVLAGPAGSVGSSVDDDGMLTSADTPGLANYGVFYNSYEPTFYTGFAPRALDPKRLHLHVGSGNQLRVTLVLSDEVIQRYVDNLLARYQGYRALIDSGRLVLTQNRAFEQFEQAIRDHGLETMQAGQRELSTAEIRQRNLQLMRKLNSQRVFSIRYPEQTLLNNWRAQLNEKDRRGTDNERRLLLLNQMLPNRLWITETDKAMRRALKQLIQLAADDDPGWPEAFFALLKQLSGDIYPRRDGIVQFDEFTALYPIGTFNEYTTYKGRKIPLYPTPGRWIMTTHQRTKTPDHIPSNLAYSYSPWLPYMHVGKTLHNSFHTLWWTMKPENTGFLPDELKQSPAKSREGDDYLRLWLLSRGPMSHGCTHVNAGHIMELRELLPAEGAQLARVSFFINKSYLFDVFDIDGDFRPEVMGVRYFVAFSLHKKQPDRLRAPIERRAFYNWLYGGKLDYDNTGAGRFHDIEDGQFVDKFAINGRHYQRVPLYEADYQPEMLQFYQLVDIPFARELRKIGADHPFGTQP